jgi:hypothetical protein
LHGTGGSLGPGERPNGGRQHVGGGAEEAVLQGEPGEGAEAEAGGAHAVRSGESGPALAREQDPQDRHGGVGACPCRVGDNRRQTGICEVAQDLGAPVCPGRVHRAPGRRRGALGAGQGRGPSTPSVPPFKGGVGDEKGQKQFRGCRLRSLAIQPRGRKTCVWSNCFQNPLDGYGTKLKG